MGDWEISTFFIHWMLWAKETRGIVGFKEAVFLVHAHPRFAKMSPLYQGQVEGFAAGVMAKEEGLVT